MNNNLSNNAVNFEQVSKLANVILSSLGETAVKFVEPVSKAIVECKSIIPDTVVRMVATLEPGFEKFSEQFFHYLEKRNFEALILNDPNYTKEEKEDLLLTVHALRTETFKKRMTIATGCFLSAVAVAGTFFLAKQNMDASKEIRLKELSVEKTAYRCACFADMNSVTWEALANIFNPIRGIKSIH